ncbi:MAG: hypothetical protein RLZZ490_2330 [Cyanobacteriota bacterium]|jgi:hypothetical protein
MNFYLPRLVKGFYRREPISSFVLIMAAVDIVLGGVDGKWSLFSVGIVVAFLGLGIRWWQGQKTEAIAVGQAPRRYLPPSPSSRPPLPMLTKQRRG